MTKESIRRNIMKEALTEKVNDLLFNMTDNHFDTESEAYDFVTVVRELIKEYDLPKELLLDKICLLTSSEYKYFLCMEQWKETVMNDTMYFGENIELIATW